MTGAVRALIVEDDAGWAEEFALAVESLGLRPTVVDNRADALDRFAAERFSLVLLDLEIKSLPDSIKPHPEAGRDVLRQIRRLSPVRTGVALIVVSAHASDMEEAVELMSAGADYVLKKTASSRTLSEEIRRALNTRQGGPAATTEAANTSASRLLTIPAIPRKRRYLVRVNDSEAWLTEASLLLLLQLAVGRLEGRPLNKTTIHGGLQAISRLRGDLARCGKPGDSLVVTRGEGAFSLADDVRVGSCDPSALGNIAPRFGALAAEIEASVAADESR